MIRAYLSAASTTKDRAMAVSIGVGAFSVGAIIGPGTVHFDFNGYSAQYILCITEKVSKMETIIVRSLLDYSDTPLLTRAFYNNVVTLFKFFFSTPLVFLLFDF